MPDRSPFAAPPPPPDPAPFDEAEYRRRQQSGARATGLVLVAFCVIVFFITIAKMGLAQ